MKKGKIELPWGDFHTCAAGLRPAFLLGLPELWRALPKGYECFELNS
jgi:hypothetical protein